MAVRSSQAEWQGNLRAGNGTMKLGSGMFEGPFTFASRFESGKGTNPEELIGAAHAGCFSMFLAALLSGDGYVPNSVKTTATVHLGDGPTITKIELDCVADVPDIDAETFADYAVRAKEGCPVSKALAAVPEIVLDASLA
ncbi:MAG: OsmC family protein [Caldilineaceae bacterium]|nr:OsmC family protein [Caldilineaceae bacterium]